MPRFITAKNLLDLSTEVVLSPLKGRSIFYYGSGGAAAAKRLAKSNYSFTRIDDLLNATGAGRQLLSELIRLSCLGEHTWTMVEEVWWNLSRRFAEASSGDVFCFGETRDLFTSGDASMFRSRFNHHRYLDEVFWKVELPALEINDKVDKIFLNGKEI